MSAYQSADQPTVFKTVSLALLRRVLTSLARITITGRENIPADGPLIVAGNHLSTIDALLVMLVLPTSTRFVGPADFELLFPANRFPKWAGVIRVKRSLHLERSSLRQMQEVLTGGGRLLIFPEGGTWEKPIINAKGGAAYLSMVTQTPILPVGLGYTYQSWYKIARLQRPHLTLNIGPLLPPVAPPADRSRRTEAVEEATHLLMERIYNLLPPETRAFYDDQARRRWALVVEVWRGAAHERCVVPGGAALAEMITKPNLISPLVRNAGLPLDAVLYHKIRFTPGAMRLSCRTLLEALRGPFSEYLEYRLGDTKAREVCAALEGLLALVGAPEVTGIMLTPTSRAD